MNNRNHDSDDASVLFRAAELLEERGEEQAAFRCLFVAANLGHSGSQVNLGNMYSSGAGTRKNFKLAARWYAQAFRNGRIDGAFNLGLDRKRQGQLRSAITWFKKATTHGHGGAFVELARIFEQEGQEDRARALLEQALKLDRDHLSEIEEREARMLLRSLTLN